MREIEEEIKRILQSFLHQRRVCGPVESKDKIIKVYNINPNLVRVDIRIPDTNKEIQEIIKESEDNVLRPALRWFAGELEMDLKRCDSIKGGNDWLGNNPGFHLTKIARHVIDFQATTNIQEAMKYCIHGANHFMMIADNLRVQLEKGLLKFKSNDIREE